MAYRKFISRHGKVYGPYIYKSRRENGRVITDYVGKAEKERKITFGFLSFVTLLTISLVIMLHMFYPTGKVIFDISNISASDASISGQARLVLKYGELLPADSIIKIALGNQAKEFPISELVSAEKTSGNFFVENTLSEGFGEGYGTKGTKRIYPEVYFRLKIERTTGKEPSVSIPEGSQTPQAETTQSSSQTSSGGSQETQKKASIGIPETPIEEPVPAESKKEQTMSVTGEAIEGEFIDGSVTGVKDFNYNLKEGESASIEQGSVRNETDGLSDNAINLRVENGKAVVSADLVYTEEGFGEEYIEEETLNLVMDMEEFGLAPEQGTLELEVIFENKTLVYGEKNIVFGAGKGASIGIPEQPIEPEQPQENITMQAEELQEENVTEENVTEKIKEPMLGIQQVASGVVLNSTSGTNYTTENLTVYYTLTDADRAIINWNKNNKNIMLLNMPFEGGSNSTWTKDYAFGYNGNANYYPNYPFWNATGGYDRRGAYEFNGSVQMAVGTQSPENNPSILGNFTISAWVKLKSLKNQTIISKEEVGWYCPTYVLSIYNSKVLCWFTTSYPCGGWGTPVLSTYTFTTSDFDKWYFITCTYNGTGITYYINGSFDSSAARTGYPFYYNTMPFIGNSYLGTSYFNGTIDEVRIYNISLRAEQIQALYNRTDLIVSQETEIGDTWQACVTPNNGSQDGSKECSNNLTIIQGHLNMTLNIEPNPVSVGSNLSIYGRVNFSDGRDLQNTTVNIFLNGSLISEGNYSDYAGQWASGATATNNYVDNPASKMTGAPDVLSSTCTDNLNAWASTGVGDDSAQLNLTYSNSVYATEVRIRETYVNGFIKKIEFEADDGSISTVWQAGGSYNDTTSCPSNLWLNVTFEPTLKKGKKVILYTNGSKGNYEEIDAVQLLGYLDKNSTKTNSTGGYLFNYNVSIAGSYEVKVNTSYGNLYAESNATLVVQGLANATYNNFAGNTTDFENHPTPWNITNATLEVIGNGTIRWLVNVNATNQNFDLNVNISGNRIFVNSSGLHSSFNGSAELTLYNLDIISPKIEVAIDNENFAECNELTDPACSIVSYASGTFVFNVSHFTTYRAMESAGECDFNLSECKLSGWQSGKTYCMNQSIFSTNTCFNITSNNVTLDCKGFNITGDRTKNGVIVKDNDNVTIINCVISSYFYGIQARNSTNLLVENSTITNSVKGIQGDVNISNIVLLENKIKDNTGTGIHLTAGSTYFSNALIQENEIINNTDNGIYLEYSAGDSIINNTIAYSNYGIYTRFGEDYVISYNTISNNTRGEYQNAINLESTNDTVISNNIFSGNNYTILVFGGSNNTIIHNVIKDSIEQGIQLSLFWAGDFLYPSLNHITNNTIINSSSAIILSYGLSNFITNNTVANNTYGLFFIGSTYNNISGNNLTNNTNGIVLEVDIIGIVNNSYNMFFNNKIIEGNVGINITSGSQNNTIYSNYFSNSLNAYDEDRNNWNITKTSGTNIIGKPWLGGNYWSDYSGIDTTGDFLGDTLIPYNSSGNISTAGDWLPLTSSSYLVACNTTLNEGATMISDIECNGTSGLTLSGGDYTFDCAGYTISNNLTVGAIAIDVTGQNITIKNCKIKGFSGGIKYQANAHNGKILNTSVYDGRLECTSIPDPYCYGIDIYGDNINITTLRAWNITSPIFFENSASGSNLNDINIQNITASSGIGFWSSLSVYSSNHNLSNIELRNLDGNTIGILAPVKSNYIHCTNITIYNAYSGFYISEGDYFHCHDCKVINSASNGIYVLARSPSASNIVNITNPIVTNGKGVGIQVAIQSYSSAYISNATIFNNTGIGLSLGGGDGGNNFTVTNCNISNNGGYGISAGEFDAEPDWPLILLKLDSCNILNNGGDGMHLESQVGSIINNTNISNNRGYGIYGYPFMAGKIENTIITNSSNHGIHFLPNWGRDWPSSWNTFNNIKIYNSSNYSIYLESRFGIGVDHNVLQNIFTQGNSYGIVFEDADYNNVTNYISNNDSYGIYLNSSNNSLITNSTFTDDGYAVYLAGNSTGNLIYNNIFNSIINAFDDSTTGNLWNISKTSGTNIIGRPYTGGNYWGGVNGYTGADTTGDYMGDSLIPWNSGGNISIGGDYLPLVYEIYTPPAPGGGGECRSSWSCARGQCVGGFADETCIDTKNCVLSNNLPAGCKLSGTGRCTRRVQCEEVNVTKNVTLPRRGRDCYENWECQYSFCQEDYYEYPINCVDLKHCGTTYGMPKPIRCFCVPKFVCGEWGKCGVDYNLKDLIEGNVILKGKQERLCRDMNLCVEAVTTEYQECSVEVPVEIRVAKWCNEDYIEIYEKETRKLVSRIKESINLTRLDLSFIPTSIEGYCDYCFNGMKDYDEEGVDCGGSCTACLGEYKDNFPIIKAIIEVLTSLALAYLVYSLVRAKPF
jgi:parallel beta-helix repeat protein